MHRRHALTAASALVLIASAGLLVAGPLAPPAGPVAGTYKTLSEIEPRTAVNTANTPGDNTCAFKISQPGSYYLTDNAYIPASRDGIQITANNVTLDLNGFAIIGAVGSNSGITITGSQGCAVRNGAIRGFNSSGLYSQRPGCIFEHLTISNNNYFGLFAASYSQISDCVVQDSGSSGYVTSEGCVLRGCVAKGNGSAATDSGFNLGDRNVAIGCSASGNYGAGIFAGHGSRITDCQANSNAVGIQTYTTGLVTGCSSSQNTSDGIRAGNDTTVRGCSCTYNGDDGIQGADDCVISGNSCQANGFQASGAGVFLVGSNCRVEDNQLTYNRYGVLINNAYPDNFVARNTARNNSGGNFAVPAGTNMAPVVNPGTTFSGATAWSNFSF